MAGRRAYQVTGTPRLAADLSAWPTAKLDRVDLLIDAELGLVLRRELFFEGQSGSTLELIDLEFDSDVAADSESFRPGEDIKIDPDDLGWARSDQHWQRYWDPDPEARQPGKGDVARTLARGATYLAVRGLARPAPTRDKAADSQDKDHEAEMPAASSPALDRPALTRSDRSLTRCLT